MIWWGRPARNAGLPVLRRQVRSECLKMDSREILGVGAPLTAPSFRAVREPPLQDPHHFPTEFLVLRQFQTPVPPLRGQGSAPRFAGFRRFESVKNSGTCYKAVSLERPLL